MANLFGIVVSLAIVMTQNVSLAYFFSLRLLHPFQGMETTLVLSKSSRNKYDVTLVMLVLCNRMFLYVV